MAALSHHPIQPNSASRRLAECEVAQNPTFEYLNLDETVFNPTASNHREIETAMVRALAFAFFIALSLRAPLPQQERAPLPEIKLEMVPVNIVDGVPTGFTFVLTNVSNADLYLPLPDIDCGNRTPRGTIWLAESWAPLSGDGLGKGNAACDFGSVYPSPQMTLEGLTKSWKLLHSGEALRVSADESALHFNPAGSGTYTFSARYTPPDLSPDAQRLLSQSGIIVPKQIATTPDQQYARP